MGAEPQPPLLAQPAPMVPRDHHLALPETQDAAAMQQLKVQREMQLLEGRIRGAANLQNQAAQADELNDER